MFVSYAQNFEDVVLWRALYDVQDGFYIDIGASDPDQHSVTRAFYERGWRGVNVEPIETHFQRLCESRRRDVNINAVVGSFSEGVRFFEVGEGDGLSTLSEDTARDYRNAGLAVTERTVSSVTLSELLEKHSHGDVHFLKIDVEGAERAVLSSGDFKNYRPWIVVVEAIRPFNSLQEHDPVLTYFDRAQRCDAEWRDLLLESGYEACFFDGLNAYFVAQERVDSIGSRLSIPANVLDDALPVELVRLREERLELVAQIGELSRYAELVGEAIKAISEGLYSTTEFFGRAEAARQEILTLLGRDPAANEPG